MIEWRGPEVKKAMDKAIRGAIDETTSKAVLFAKQNHPGWKNRSTVAEGSVRVQEFAHKISGHIHKGVWGSVDVNYILKLEFNYGSFLRNAADKEYPGLVGRIRKRLA
ncbi:MAG: hypothetical protein NOU37_09260 [Candidatus Brocadiales bacterium]|nr:hypothetical protein [Candidatus Bathyanammoxibius amoris]